MDQALESQSAQRQVRLSTLFWLMMASAFLLAHARSLGADGLWLLGYYLLFVVLSSALVGIAFGGWADVAYWSALTSLLAFLAVAGGHLPDPSIGVGWGLVGAACGAMIGLAPPKNVLFGVLVSGTVGLVAMLVVVLCHQVKIDQLIAFDIGCSAVVGATLRPFGDLLKWFEAKSKNPRVVLAAWLAICVMVGNMLVPVLTGIHR